MDLCCSMYNTYGCEFLLPRNTSEIEEPLHNTGLSNMWYNYSGFLIRSGTLDSGHVGLCGTTIDWKGWF